MEEGRRDERAQAQGFEESDRTESLKNRKDRN